MALTIINHHSTTGSPRYTVPTGKVSKIILKRLGTGATLITLGSDQYSLDSSETYPSFAANVDATYQANPNYLFAPASTGVIGVPRVNYLTAGQTVTLTSGTALDMEIFEEDV